MTDGHNGRSDCACVCVGMGQTFELRVRFVPAATLDGISSELIGRKLSLRPDVANLF